MTTPPLGISLWSINHLLPPDLRQVIDAGAPCPAECEEGVRACFSEVADLILASEDTTVELWPSPILRSGLATQGLERLAAAGRISSMHAPFRDLSSLDDADRQASVSAHIEAAKLLSGLGGKTLVVHGSMHFEDQAELPERSRRSARSIAEVADACADLGVKVAIEILPPPFVGHSAGTLLHLLANVDRPNVGVCIDVNHVFPPDDLIPTIRLLAPSILTLHISDYDGAERHWLPMQGVIDWPALVRVLREINYPGAFVYEVFFEAPSVAEGVRIIRENYRKVMGEA